MLIEFSVENFRSFRERVTFSMVASKLRAKHAELDENTVFELEGQPPLLTSAAIYGANASGKSNFVAAIASMRTFVRKSQAQTQATGAIEAEPFLLSTETENQPSHFEMVFVMDGVRYRYGYEITAERVTAEWLFYVPRVRETRLFERTGQEIELGAGFKEGKDLIAKTRPNALFLSVVAQFNGATAQSIISWFQKLGIASGLEDTGMRIYTMEKFLDGEYRDDIIRLFKSLDLGIEDVNVEDVEMAEHAFPDEMPEPVKNALKTLIEHGGQRQIGVKTVHPRYDAGGNQTALASFDLDLHESEGSRKLFALAGPLAAALRHGQVLVIDEMDARLHPIMTCEIIRLFNSRETNPHHAQLIFTTYDTNLLSNNLFRRDQIWFAEKNRYGATDLYSLAEFKVRNDASFEKDYIKGRYGAIPMLGDLRRVLETR